MSATRPINARKALVQSRRTRRTEIRAKEAPGGEAAKQRKGLRARSGNAQRGSAGKRPGRVRNRAVPELPLPARLAKQSERLFRACSIVEACYRATASLYPPQDPEFIVPALETAHEMIGDVAGDIDAIAENLPPKRRSIS